MAVDTLPAGPGLVLVSPGGRAVTVPVQGQKIIIPSGDNTKLAGNNEFILDSNRLTLEESPFGGYKGAADYAPGTVYTPTAGVVLTDLAGNNATQVLGAGLLKSLNLLDVDTANKTITEEFILKNTSLNNNELTLIDVTLPATGWDFGEGSGGFIESDGFNIIITGTTDSSGYFTAYKIISAVDLSQKQYFKVTVESSLSGYTYLGIGSSTANYSRVVNKSSVAISADTPQICILPFKAPSAATGSNPNYVGGTPNWSAVTFIKIGIKAAANTAFTLTVSNISADTGKTAYVEIQTANNLADSSLQVQVWDGAAYQICGTYKLDETYSFVSGTSANWKLNDTTKLDDVYGSGLGRAVFVKGAAGATVAGSTGNMTYSNNRGTSRRVGVMVSLPPSDGDRTNLNKIRLKTIIYYANSGSTTYEFTDSATAAYGLLNMSAPWLALLDTSGHVEYYIFTDRPAGVAVRRDDTGAIYELEINPGNSQVFRGVSWLPDQTTDTDADLIPDSIKNLLMPALSGWNFNG